MDNALRYPGHWSLEADQRGTLCLFLKRASEFRSLGTFRYPAEATVGIMDGDAYSEAELPPELNLRSAAQSARHFYLQKESTQFGRVCNMLFKATTEHRFQEEVARIRSSFNDLLGSPLNPTTGEPEIHTQGDMIEAYFNGHYFHSDPKLRAFVDKDSEVWGPLHKQAFAQTLLGIYHHVRWLSPVVENALGVDQLARCPTSKRIQSVLQQHGLGPAPVTVSDCYICSTDPPTVGLRCDLDLYLPEDVVSAVLGKSLEFLLDDRPGYPEYVVWYRNLEGEYRGIVHPTVDPPVP